MKIRLKTIRYFVEGLIIIIAIWRYYFSSNHIANLKARAMDQIFLFGDSITQFAFNPILHGWGAILAHKYMSKLDVINRGYSGFNTEWCKHLLAENLRSLNESNPSTRIRIMTLFLGANDAVDPAFNQRHNVSLPRYKQNMHEMLDTVRRESPGTKVIIITPPPVNPEVYKETCKAKGKVRDRNAQHTKKYRDACIEVFMEAAETWGRDLVLVDIWYVFFGVGRAEHELKELEDLLFDGLHLGMKGNQLLGKALLETINHSWPELNPDVLPVVGGIEK